MHDLVIPTPDSLRNIATESDRAEVNSATRAIVKELESYWPTDNGYVSVSVSCGSVRNRVVNLVVHEFARHGWRVTYHSEQRDGDWWEIREG